MANKLVYSWADKLRQINPPRKYIATSWRTLEKPSRNYRKKSN